MRGVNEDGIEIERVEEDAENACAHKDHEVHAEGKDLGRDPQEDHEHESVHELYCRQISVDLFKSLVSLLSKTSNYL